MEERVALGICRWRRCLGRSESKTEFHSTHQHKVFFSHFQMHEVFQEHVILTAVGNHGKAAFCFLRSCIKCSPMGKIRSLMAMPLVVFVTKTTHLPRLHLQRSDFCRAASDCFLLAPDVVTSNLYLWKPAGCYSKCL